MKNKEPIQRLPKPQSQFSKQEQWNADTLIRENRCDIRKPYFMTVEYATDDRLYQEFIFNISGGGVYIETRQPLPVGQKISLTFTLPDHQTHIKTSGSVVRADTQGIGVAFRTNDPDTRRQIADAVAEL